MAQLTELLTKEDLEKAWDMSKEKPVLLFKQSTTCPISAEAFKQYNAFIDETDLDVGTYFVKVRETRELSNQIAEETGIQHQSPQIFLVKDKQVLWNTSHSSITQGAIKEALTNEG
ncbi:bacillithiol system redox-active protein YtxJ [Virgibacillus sp. MSJ-26]|uniref:bacillithiol system redox-active protein YtxJ n=1 Tax=Virgibacillus sp. MSJ-26 TaxID=2841522 RepID=UPI001C0FA672|nr:bacillithiol system redox-active protein YtxJ [Virgibacillus sp. MSJ-26]MBU5466814.1 bacillithiol system redox-active protein YtxJ [Virgibacillus sp. MSJ-26]